MTNTKTKTNKDSKYVYLQIKNNKTLLENDDIEFLESLLNENETKKYNKYKSTLTGLNQYSLNLALFRFIWILIDTACIYQTREKNLSHD